MDAGGDEPSEILPPNTEMCHHCNGYGSSLKEPGARCSMCGGSGVVEKHNKLFEEVEK